MSNKHEHSFPTVREHTRITGLRCEMHFSLLIVAENVFMSLVSPFISFNKHQVPNRCAVLSQVPNTNINPRALPQGFLSPREEQI